jgi:hypothetical protein
VISTARPPMPLILGLLIALFALLGTGAPRVRVWIGHRAVP